MEHEEAHAPVSAGGPVYVRHVLGRPLAVLVVAAVAFFTGAVPGVVGSVRTSVIAGSVLIAAAGVLLIAGYVAYRDLSSHSVDRYVMVSAISLFLCGVALSSSRVGWLPLLWAGWLLGDSRFAAVRRVYFAVPERMWTRTALTAGITGIACMLLLPLAVGLGSSPLVAIMMAGRILAPLILGVTWRIRRGVDAQEASVTS
ncbi:MAG: hypothetical protein JSS74_17445 [Actinobacteria bacterium]|nr:hypothetical protein [Actinomycetota bacterium]